MLKKALAAVVSSAILLSCAGMTAFAADTAISPSLSSTSSSYSTRGTKAVYSDIWTTIYSKSNYATNIQVHDLTGRYYDICMYDASGTQVWYQDHSIAPNGTGYYYLGSNVRTVQLRVSDGKGPETVNVSES